LTSFTHGLNDHWWTSERGGAGNANLIDAGAASAATGINPTKTSPASVMLFIANVSRINIVGSLGAARLVPAGICCARSSQPGRWKVCLNTDWWATFDAHYLCIMSILRKIWVCGGGIDEITFRREI
jgi:hypothetical protein